MKVRRERENKDRAERNKKWTEKVNKTIKKIKCGSRSNNNGWKRRRSKRR